ncbi:MAG: RsmB/NOP family class I SAM-dependent RNA methyltransferase [Bacteroidetes bacterium]|nr:RsmB/NOP family class I SAM-dependent RNA methyltransferase [Bacteroidota bacterium]
MIQLSDNIADYLRANFGSEFLEKYEAYIYQDFTPYIRIPGNTIQQESIATGLSRYGIQLENIAGVPNAYKVLSGIEKAGKTLEFALGKYYIQSLSSMIPPLILNPSETDITLDMCAAPGSKTTQLSELMNNRGTLYSNEVSVNRTKSLVYNIDKMSITNIGVLQMKGELLGKYFPNYFDKILVDAPCSGLGIVQRKQEVSNWWNKKQAEKIGDTQLRLLISAIKSTRVGGEILYSTCTLTLEENELIINKVLEKYPVELVEIELPVKSHPGFVIYNGESLNSQLSKTRRIVPWEVSSEGFFIAKLVKTEITEKLKSDNQNKSAVELLNAKDRNMKKHLSEIEARYGIPLSDLNNYRYLKKGNDLFFINKNWKRPPEAYFIRIGTKFGLIDKRGNAYLHTISALHFADLITKNIVALENENELQIYLNGGIIKKDYSSYGQKIVKFNSIVIGTAVASKDGLKSQFPRAMRTHEILI